MLAHCTGLEATVIVLIMGLAKLGGVIKFIPAPVVTGFTSGIAIIIFSSQIKDLFALLAKHFPGCLVAFDSHTPVSLAYSNRRDPIRNMKARMVWAIRDIHRIAAWAPGYKVVESVPVWDAPEYAKYASRLPWTLRLFYAVYPPCRRMYRIDLVQLGGSRKWVAAPS